MFILSVLAKVPSFFFLLLLLFFFVFLGPHVRHMEIPKLEVESEPQLLAYAIATETWDPNYVCNLYLS